MVFGGIPWFSYWKLWTRTSGSVGIHVPAVSELGEGARYRRGLL